MLRYACVLSCAVLCYAMLCYACSVLCDAGEQPALVVVMMKSMTRKLEAKRSLNASTERYVVSCMRMCCTQSAL